MTDGEAWADEERFWTAAETYWREALHPQCIMAFPLPAGIMAGAEILESLKGAPRWLSVEMTDRRLGRFSDDLVVLGYRATGWRAEGAPYRALCTSAYRGSGRRWLLVQHQQTPVAPTTL
ncbi:MAG: hypothetical protein ACOY4R_16630 [Pseudomonadota bacterium]